MDDLITAAWRTFWVGLGASAVLIVQSLVVTPEAPVAAPRRAAEQTVPVTSATVPEPSAASAVFAPRLAVPPVRGIARVPNAS